MKQKTKKNLLITSIVIGSILLVYLILALFFYSLFVMGDDND